MPLCRLTAAALITTAFAATYSPAFTAQSTNLRAHLLGNGYDSRVAPTSLREPGKSNVTSLAGTDVSVNLRVFRLDTVSLADGVLNLRVWMRLAWTDLRLAWDPDDFGGLRQVYFVAADVAAVEGGEIWTPDVSAWNAQTGIAQTLESSLALVSHTGEVYWSRPGSLVALCKFSDIISFPFDRPSCTVEIGGYMLSGAYQGLTAGTADFTPDGALELAAGTSYAECTPVPA